MIKAIKNWIKRRRDAKKMHWVGTVEGKITSSSTDGSKYVKNKYWNLYESLSGDRYFEEIGITSKYDTSTSSRISLAAIEAWKHGGPIPELHTSPPSKAKRSGDLIVFTGGKGSA